MLGKDKQTNKYRRKYKYIKRIIKSLLIENAALCDEVAKIQESIQIVKDERRFLLRKLVEYENETDVSQSSKNMTSNANIHNGTSSKVKKLKSPEVNGRKEC